MLRDWPLRLQLQKRVIFALFVSFVAGTRTSNVRSVFLALCSGSFKGRSEKEEEKKEKKSILGNSPPNY